MICALLFVLLLKFQTCKAEKHAADNKETEQENTKEFMLKDILNNENDNFNDKRINALNELLNMYDETKKSQASSLAKTFFRNDNKKTEPNIFPWLMPDLSDSYNPNQNPIRLFTNFPWKRRVVDKPLKDKQAPALPWLIPNFFESSEKNDNNIKTLLKLPWFRYDSSISNAPRPWNKEELEEHIYGDNRKLDDNILFKKDTVSRSSEKAVLLRWIKDTIESYEDREKPRLYFGSAIMPWNKQEADSLKNNLKFRSQKNKNKSFKSLWKRPKSLGFQRSLEKNEFKSPWQKEDLSVESFLKGMESLGLLRNDKNLHNGDHNDVNFQTKEDTTLKNLISSLEKESSKINNEIANYELYEKINEFLSSKNSSETDS